MDPEELAEVEVYQFVGQFAAMILNISKLHKIVEEQRKELNEMTEILFKILVEAVVGEVEARRAAAFLTDESSQELTGASESGGLQGIDSIRFPIDREKHFKRCIESGRIVTYKDYTEKLNLGPNLLGNWVVLCLKGRERPQGVLVTEVRNEDTGNSISILVNYSSCPARPGASACYRLARR